jgi:hypothetical protein
MQFTAFCKSAISYCLTDHDCKLLLAQKHAALPNRMTKPEPITLVLIYTFCGRFSETSSLDSIEGACWPGVQVAAGMMAGCLPAGSCAARIMLFAGGPPTVGSGKVVDMELVQPIRSAVLLRLMLLPMC